MVLYFTRPREVAAHTICAASGSQVCGSHYVAISWDCSNSTMQCQVVLRTMWTTLVMILGTLTTLHLKQHVETTAKTTKIANSGPG